MNDKQPKYPCFYISFFDWNDEWLGMMLASVEIKYTMDKEVIDKYILNSEWIDSNGDIFKVVGVDKLARWRRFMPFITKTKMVTEYTGRSMTLEEFRSYMLNMIDTLDLSSAEARNAYEKWRQELLKAQSFVELMG